MRRQDDSGWHLSDVARCAALHVPLMPQARGWMGARRAPRDGRRALSPGTAIRSYVSFFRTRWATRIAGEPAGTQRIAATLHGIDDQVHGNMSLLGRFASLTGRGGGQ